MDADGTVVVGDSNATANGNVDARRTASGSIVKLDMVGGYRGLVLDDEVHTLTTNSNGGKKHLPTSASVSGIAMGITVMNPSELYVTAHVSMC